MLLQEDTGRTNIYSTGTILLVMALEASALCSMRRHQHQQAIDDLDHALLLLRAKSRCMPTQQVSVALSLASKLRVQAEKQRAHSQLSMFNAASEPSEAATAMVAAAGGPAEQAEAKLARSRELLEQALTMSTLDGAHHHGLLRDSLMEMATVHAATGNVGAAAAALKSAYAASVKGMLVEMSSHLLQPVVVAQLPEWAVEYVKGQEEHFNATALLQAGPAKAVPASDVDVGRKVVCLFVNLQRQVTKAIASDRQQIDAKRSVLYQALRTACPKYVAEACFPDVPLPPASSGTTAAPGPPAGTVIVQWHVHVNGCSREQGSWIATGSLPPSGLTQAQVLGLQPVPCYVSMVFVVAPPVPDADPAAAATAAAAPGKKAAAEKAAAAAAVPGTGAGSGAPPVVLGERIFPVETIRDIQRRVTKLRHRTESPRLPTDLFGEAAPDEQELAKVQAAVERLLAQQRRLSVDGKGALSDQDDEDEDGFGEDGTLDSTSVLEAPGAQGRAAGADRPAGPAVDLAFLTKLEAMLCLETGVDMVDAAFAGWLSELLRMPGRPSSA
jgi:hypothetical protein